MTEQMQLAVREIEKRDFDLIADYWLHAEPEFLIGMGVDLQKLPARSEFKKMLNEQIELPYERKRSYALIWMANGEPIGHSNINEIEFGKQAKMHLHLWKSGLRHKGLGFELIKMSLPYFFEKLELEVLWCEPYAHNPAPNKTLKKLGFNFVKKHINIPGSLNFEQETNLWKLTKEKYLALT